MDDEKVAEVVDENAADARGKPKFGLGAAKWPGDRTDTRVYFDDFRIARLS
ncbi:hypothetical protein [Planobispora rosea]|uniref:hypothetical protein n=1 Tax=Planobispora rosea TaxID=35762 RepID=UPI00159F196E|nr:hypothetical protein [Planobispora rosea]